MYSYRDEREKLKQHEKELRKKEAKKNSNYFRANKVTDIQRKALMYRSGGKCQRCGNSNSLSIVRIIPVRHGGSSWSIQNMKVVCDKCKIVVLDNPRLNW